MRSTKPPALATWLLEHAALGNKNDALRGDLLEEFAKRSRGWYWRQVLVVILVSLLREVRLQWLTVLAAAAFTIAIPPFWKYLVMEPRVQNLFGKSINHDWPLSIIYVIAVFSMVFVLMTCVGLSIFLLASRSFTPHRFLRRLMVALFFYTIGSVVQLSSVQIPIAISSHLLIFAPTLTVLLSANKRSSSFAERLTQ